MTFKINLDVDTLFESIYDSLCYHYANGHIDQQLTRELIERFVEREVNSVDIENIYEEVYNAICKQFSSMIIDDLRTSGELVENHIRNRKN